MFVPLPCETTRRPEHCNSRRGLWQRRGVSRCACLLICTPCMGGSLPVYCAVICTFVHYARPGTLAVLPWPATEPRRPSLPCDGPSLSPGPRLGGGCGLPAGALSRRLPYGEATLRPGCTVLIEGRVQWWRTAQGSRSRNTQAVIAERIQCLSCPRQTPCAAASGGGTRRGAQLVGGPSVATALPG